MEDCIIIGAGAAGLFAAGAAVHAGKRVTVLEHMDAPGKKAAHYRQGRCNVTNNCGPDEFFENAPQSAFFVFGAQRLPARFRDGAAGKRAGRAA